MRILIISFRFPPYNSIGAVRVGKTAKYLMAMGHEVRVITAKDQPLRTDLPLEIPSENVAYTHWVNVNRLAEVASGGRAKVAQRGFRASTRQGAVGRLGVQYKNLVNIPDGQVGWIPFAVRAGAGMIRDWKPDVIFASASPFSGLVVAKRLARRFRIPWVGELRDLWVDGGYGSDTGWRIAIDRLIERRTLSTAAGLVTVSPPLAAVLEKKFSKPTEVILNGFDFDDLVPPQPIREAHGPFRIVYTGMIYENRRDPSPLFDALRLLGQKGERVRVEFYGRYLDVVNRLARERGVEHLVSVRDAVSYHEALRIQRDADVLLLLLWNSPAERGVYTGKLFEYLAARRPILLLGPEDNVAAELVRERGAGTVSYTPSEIASALSEWLGITEELGRVPDLPESVLVGLSRAEQVEKLSQFLTSLRER